MSTLHDIQLAIQKRLQSQAYFAGIPVITQNDGDYDTKVQTVLSRMGIACLILLGTADIEDPAQTGPYFGSIKYVVEVSEFVQRNRSAQGSGKPALDVCERVCQLIHHYEFADGKTLYCIRPTIMAVRPPVPATAAYHCQFETSDGMDLSEIEE